VTLEVYVLRDEVTPDGVRGVLRLGSLELFTLEDDWKDNQPGESCIPAGRYRLQHVQRPADKGGYWTYEIEGVPGRSLIRIHPGNTEEDVQGCLLVGLQRGFTTVARDEDTGTPHVSKRSVLLSKEAFRQFMSAMDEAAAGWITIEWAIGLP
jgi:hypothetical protein